MQHAVCLQVETTRAGGAVKGQRCSALPPSHALRAMTFLGSVSRRHSESVAVLLLSVLLGGLACVATAQTTTSRQVRQTAVPDTTIRLLRDGLSLLEHVLFNGSHFLLVGEPPGLMRALSPFSRGTLENPGSPSSWEQGHLQEEAAAANFTTISRMQLNTSSVAVYEMDSPMALMMDFAPRFISHYGHWLEHLARMGALLAAYKDVLIKPLHAILLAFPFCIPQTQMHRPGTGECPPNNAVSLFTQDVRVARLAFGEALGIHDYKELAALVHQLRQQPGLTEAASSRQPMLYWRQLLITDRVGYERRPWDESHQIQPRWEMFKQAAVRAATGSSSNGSQLGAHKLILFAQRSSRDCEIPNCPPRHLPASMRRQLMAGLEKEFSSRFQVLSVRWNTVSADEQVALASRSAALVGVHGNNLYNGLFVPAGSCLVEIGTPGYWPNHFTLVANMSGLLFGGFSSNTSRMSTGGWPAFANAPFVKFGPMDVNPVVDWLRTECPATKQRPAPEVAS